MSLRQYVVVMFHCTPLGPHRSRDRTLGAITDAGLWWSSMYQDVQGAVRGCLICSSEKTTPLVSGQQRSREYDGPFRYLIIDFVGPMTPPSARGNRYMFTCVCGWSGYYWAVACPDDTSETAAHCLFYHVICDIAGYPMFLGSDRAKAFLEGVLHKLLDYFGIKHVIRSAYHPQAQSAVERPHREYNAMCKTFMDSTRDWDLVAMIFVWTIRTSAKIFNGHFTPYETVTGMKPRTPIDTLLGAQATLERVSTTEYVRDLVTYLKDVHARVEEHHARVRDDTQRAKHRVMGPGMFLRTGDYVLVRRTPEPGTSVRFQSKHHPGIFQVVEVHGSGPDAKAYTLSDLVGKRENLGFGQPVALERLTPVEVLPLSQPIHDTPTRILVQERTRDRPGTVEAQSVDGRVYVRFDDQLDEQECVDLSAAKYRWL